MIFKIAPSGKLVDKFIQPTLLAVKKWGTVAVGTLFSVQNI
jgi:hypothetical protein